MHSMDTSYISEQDDGEVKESHRHLEAVDDTRFSLLRPFCQRPWRNYSWQIQNILRLSYTNMLDGQLDTVFSALKLLNSSDIEIVIAETGWPSKGDAGQVGVDAGNAAEYNKKLIEHAKESYPTYPAPEVPPVSPKGRQWCLPKPGAKNEALQSNIDYVCGLGFHLMLCLCHEHILPSN